MDKQAAVKLIRDTFESSFDKVRFINLSKNLFKHLDMSSNFLWAGNRLPNAGAFQPHINSIERIGKSDEQSKSEDQIDVLIVNLKKETSLERARTKQRNFVARYLEDKQRKAALVAFVPPEPANWRFSLVRMDYNMAETPGGKVKVEPELTPARRYSFLVGEHESSHTAQVQLLPILEDDEKRPLLSDFERAFNIEVVTKEFFTKYHDLFNDVKEALEGEIKQSLKVREDFEAKGIDRVNFAKKLLGQIVFLYFLQKKGWLGVPGNKNWGDGDKRFLRTLFIECMAKDQNFFNNYLEFLFYEALARQDRGTADPAYYPRFNCKVPFLNGGLFDPINSYDWVHTDILLPNELFSNQEKTKEGDTGTGILDVFDRYNFTVKEDEPLDKEVAVDPEMLGKVFENLLEVKDRKSKGTYYTPREIVHYMCQESLISYLDTALNAGEVALVAEKPVNLKLFGAPAVQQMTLKTPGYTDRVPREDIEIFVRMGELAIEHDARVENKGKETRDYSYKLPPTIRLNAAAIDDKLAGIRVCDPAIGSGAFPVGLMTEIVRARNTLTTYLPNKEGRTNYHFKRHAIQSCLYGVDIDPGAVEIAKLRLWLSLVVDEEDIKQIQPLPNLDYKIVRGNSLLGVERVEGDMFSNELEKLKADYFGETDAKKRQECREQIDKLIGSLTNKKDAFDFEVHFSEVFRGKKLDKKWQAYHITWVTHNSRVSERMVEFEVRAGEPVVLSDEWQGKITEEIRNIVREDGLRVLAYNILSDHVHMVLVCQEDELSNIVRKLKGRSSQKLKEYLGIPAEEVFHLWAQKFNTSYIDSEDKLRNAIAYVTANREKHALSDTEQERPTAMNKGAQLWHDEPGQSAPGREGHPTAMNKGWPSDTNKGRPTDVNKGWPPLVQSTIPPLVREMLTPLEHAFDPVYEKGGFDVVIANPPYIRQEELKELKPDLQKNFTCYSGVADIYVYFYERGKQILKENGTLTYISSNKYFRAGYGEKLRGFLANNCQICQIVDFGDAPVFEAIAYPSIIVLKNTRPQANEINVFNWQPGPPLAEFASVVRSGSSQMAQKELTTDGWRLESPAALRLLEKLRKAGKPLGEYVNGRFYYGIKTGLNEAFVVDRATRDRLIAEHPSSADLLKPFLRGRDVKRWLIEPRDLWLIFTRHGVDIKRYPAIQKYLAQYKKQLMPGAKGGRKPGSYEWYEIQDNIAYWREFEEPKIVWGNLAVQPKFAFADAGYYVSAPANIIVSDSRYLLGVLNSQITRYLVSQSAAERQGGYLEFKPMYISPLAIPEQPNNERISGLVSTILSTKSAAPAADVSALERQIDQLVYQLYGLTPEEIAVVEGKK